MAKVTIEDISQYTGLSRGTISRALNDRPDISQATKARVLEACKKLNYHPSPVARSLATGRHYALAVVLDDLTDRFTTAFLRGVINQAEKMGYNTTTIELTEEPETSRSRLHRLSAERVDGVLLGAAVHGDITGTLVEAVNGRPVASVAPVPGLNCDVYSPDQAESGRLAALFARHGSTVYIHAAGTRGAEARLSGFRAGCAAGGIDGDALVLRLENGSAFDAAAERLRAARVLIGSDDATAIAAMLWCARRGRDAGRDVAIIGQGNDPLGARLSPSLTTIDFSAEEIGRRAAETVIQRLGQQRGDAPHQVDVAPQLVERESTACLGRIT